MSFLNWNTLTKKSTSEPTLTFHSNFNSFIKDMSKTHNEDAFKKIASVQGSNWKAFEGKVLPESAMTFLNRVEAFQYRCLWIYGGVYYKGINPETATEWIVITNGGGNYKVHAEYAMWYTTTARSEGYSMQCVWSKTHLKKTLRNLIKTGSTLPDPGYTT